MLEASVQARNRSGRTGGTVVERCKLRQRESAPPLARSQVFSAAAKEYSILCVGAGARPVELSSCRSGPRSQPACRLGVGTSTARSMIFSCSSPHHSIALPDKQRVTTPHSRARLPVATANHSSVWAHSNFRVLHQQVAPRPRTLDNERPRYLTCPRPRVVCSGTY